MAECNREFWIGLGVPEEAADAVLAAHEAALAEALEGFVPEAEAQGRIDEAVAEAVGGRVPEAEVRQRIDAAVTQARAEQDGGEAYQRLLAERDMLRAIGGEAFEDVKPKFREQVYALLNRGRRAAPVEEQLAAIREKYEEYFIPGERPQKLPRFGGPTRGSMPRGAIGAAEQFSQAWGFGPRGNA